MVLVILSALTNSVLHQVLLLFFTRVPLLLLVGIGGSCLLVFPSRHLRLVLEVVIANSTIVYIPYLVLIEDSQRFKKKVQQRLLKNHLQNVFRVSFDRSISIRMNTTMTETVCTIPTNVKTKLPIHFATIFPIF